MKKNGGKLKIILYANFRQLEKERDIALKKQWQEAEIIKDKAVEEAIGSLRKKMKDEYSFEKEKAIAEALALARV